MDRDDRITDEALALWLSLYHEPPIVAASGSELIEAMIKSTPRAAYGPHEDEGDGPGAAASDLETELAALHERRDQRRAIDDGCDSIGYRGPSRRSTDNQG